MQQTILKWYKKLNFPKQYDKAFIDLLNSRLDFEWTDIDAYDDKSHTPQENLLAYLYFCERLEKQYNDYGIEDAILLDTLSDLVIWTNVWFSMKKELGLGETQWLKRHLSFRLFRLGRLQFCFGQFEKEYPEISVKQGENVVEVHIPADGKLFPEECIRSFANATRFFGKYFPSYEYRFYSCHSWLLDENLQSVLGERANVCRFGARFQKIDKDVSDAILQYVFGWGATRKNLFEYSADTVLAKFLKKEVESGTLFYRVFGVVSK